jgi:hypothetical protein
MQRGKRLQRSSQGCREVSTFTSLGKCSVTIKNPHLPQGLTIPSRTEYLQSNLRDRGASETSGIARQMAARFLPNEPYLPLKREYGQLRRLSGLKGYIRLRETTLCVLQRDDAPVRVLFQSDQQNHCL